MKDLRTGQLLAENIERVGSVVWATDNKTLFYTTEDAVSKRSDKFWRHAVGQPTSDLALRREETSSSTSAPAARSTSKIIFLGSYAKTSTEFRYLPADKPAGASRSSCRARPDHEYDVDHYNGLFYITTNKGAKNFRVVTAPMSDPSEKNWKVFIDHNPAVKIDGLDVLREPHRRLGARRRPDSAARHRSEDEAVASDRHRRAGLTPCRSAPTPSSTRRPCATTTSRWSRRRRSTTTT